MLNLPVLILHLGVHKTATTYFQSRLFNSKEILQSNGVGYLGLEDTRQLITSRLNDNIIVTEELKKIKKKSHTFLVSDENIIGGTEKISSDLIYPDVAARLRLLKNKLGCNEIQTHITIRNPEDYLISRYCEYLRHYRFISINQYFDSFDLKSFSWLPLLSVIESTLKCKVNVTCFEDIFVDETKYLNSITNLNEVYADAKEGGSIVRSKISLECYRILEHLADHYPAHMTKKLMNMMGNNKQKGKPTPLRPFSDEISQQLKINYERDKAQLNIL